jgi:hypothetical protein
VSKNVLLTGLYATARASYDPIELDAMPVVTTAPEVSISAIFA